MITDRRPDPARTTELVLVRSGAIVSTIKTGAVIVSEASIIRGETFDAIVNDPHTGVAYRAFDLASGTKVADVPLADVGADMLVAVGDRLLVGNRIASPGLYWMRLDGARGDVVEHERAHAMEISGNRLVATLFDGETEARTVRVYDLASGRVLWSAPAASAIAGIDGDAVVSFDHGGEGVPVLRDAATGAVRWRGEAVADKPGSVWFAGPYVFIEQGPGMTGYMRDTVFHMLRSRPHRLTLIGSFSSRHNESSRRKRSTSPESTSRLACTATAEIFHTPCSGCFSTNVSGPLMQNGGTITVRGQRNGNEAVISPLRPIGSSNAITRSASSRRTGPPTMSARYVKRSSPCCLPSSLESGSSDDSSSRSS